MKKFLDYGETELNYLRSKDKRLSEVIDNVGFIPITIENNIFKALAMAIVGQQISTKAQETIWARLEDLLGGVTPQSVEAHSVEELRSVGVSARKGQYIKEVAHRVITGALDLEGLRNLPDEEVISKLIAIKGVGRWTAESLLIEALGRLDVMSYNDLGLIRGLKTIYHHREITPRIFAQYKRRFSPYGTIAAIYIWQAGVQDSKV